MTEIFSTKEEKLKALQSKERFFAEQLLQYKDDIKNIEILKKHAGDISEMTLEELAELSHRIKSYDDVASSPFLLEVQEQIGRRVQFMKLEELRAAKQANPEAFKDFNLEEIHEGDIASGNWLFKALSDFDQRQLGLQYLSSKNAEAKLSEEQEKAKINQLRLWK